ncbi:gamma-glutamylcyclotransferase family protein [Variovorax sp. GT1P44]|uniref:gamma-glutamylcyclotransferase family protein n=1 Tax=Variovorax sp. GT1P44 TaxID=3443742 RepID=UPI003F45C1EB
MPHSATPARHVFVYGTLRCGGRNDIARFHPKPEHVANARIAGTLYDLGAYPGAVLGGSGKVVGEIYRIAPELEVQLDALEEVRPDDSGEYIKRELLVEVAGGERLPCLVYEIHPERIRGRTVISSGDWFGPR